MLLQSCLLCDTVQLDAHDSVLILNSAPDPFTQQIAQHGNIEMMLLAEDNIAAAKAVEASPASRKIALSHVAFHDYILHHQPGTIDVAVMNLLYQSGTAWVVHGLQVAAYALRAGG
ncbi:MAG: hypothetical protein JO011_20410, partial [Ktedonobacteraceae bacterium]|nr:hypothetical protein [Ktedonobacteraceae bacterium]